MANLSVRNLDESVYHRLQERATKHGVSMEEEVRQIIFHAVFIPEKISAIFQKNFGTENGINLDESIDRKIHHQPMEFDDDCT